MKNRANSRISTVRLLILILVGMGVGSGCELIPWINTPIPDAPQPPLPHSNDDAQPPRQESLPDLTISAIEVLPVQPQAGQHFSVNIYVENAGQATSGQFDLAIFIKDVSRGSAYPAGTFRINALQPGENITAYSSTDRLVNEPGSYEVHVEIQPFQFEDNNNQNNTVIKAFNVQ